MTTIMKPTMTPQHAPSRPLARNEKRAHRMTHRLTPRFTPLALALCVLATSTLHTGVAFAKKGDKRMVNETSESNRLTSRQVKYSLKQLGAQYTLQLRGLLGRAGVVMSNRGDEVVVGAKLRLNYTYSPALLSDISHINVVINDQVAYAIPVPQEQGGLNVQRDINLPARLFTDTNRLTFELVGHYTRDCEDPAHTSLWATINNDSELELTLAPLSITNDLATLPAPFFDPNDAIQVALPMVMSGAITQPLLEAAGTLSSWLGAVGNYRAMRLSTLIDQLPTQGHAVVLAVGNSLPAGINAEALQGPTVSMVTHPNDPHGKLLLVRGRNEKELRIAANAVALGSSAMSGPSALITSLSDLKPRKPYDAPKWLPSDRPVKFGELIKPDLLTVAGTRPEQIRVNVNVPPDLFDWKTKGMPLDLKYRYTPPRNLNNSTMNVSANNQFLASMRLLPRELSPTDQVSEILQKIAPSKGDPTLSQARINIPLYKLPASGQLQFTYIYDLPKDEPCKNVPEDALDNVRSTIEAESTVDISGFSHFIAMPNLAAFGNAGFPFTRMADLSETAIILPERPTLVDYTAYLNLMGMFGRSTGYPGTGVTLATASQADLFKNKDVVLIGNSSNQPLVGTWSKGSAANMDSQSRRFKLSDMTRGLMSWWDNLAPAHAQPAKAELSFNAKGTDGVLVGYESPVTAGRSVVQISANTPEGLTQVMNALQDPDMVRNIQGGMAVVRGKNVESLVSEPSYHVGKLDPLTYVQWFFSRNPLLLLLVELAGAFLLASIFYLSLRSRAAKRLPDQL